MQNTKERTAEREPRGRRKVGGAETGRGALPDRLRAYGHIHAHALFSSLGRLTRTPFATAMTVVVLAVAVALPTGVYLLVANLQQVAGNLESGNQISLFLRTSVTDSDAGRFAERLRKDRRIEAADLITREEALAEFRTYSGFGDALNALGSNPLPVVVEVLPNERAASVAEMESLLDDLAREKEVDFAQLDLLWVKRLQSMMAIAKRGVMLVASLLGIGVLFIVGNTIRLELQNRRDEVLISKLVGATNAFIRRPFIYSGFWYGFAGGVLAWFIVGLMLLLLQGPAGRLAELYQSGYRPNFLSFSESFTMISISSLLGVAGAWLTLLNHLRRLNPV